MEISLLKHEIPNLFPSKKCMSQRDAELDASSSRLSIVSSIPGVENVYC